MRNHLFLTLSLFLSLITFIAKAQNPVLLGQDTTRRPINTAVPFMMIAPDARSSGMGDVGVATSADVNAGHWNAAKLVFLENKFGASLSFSPWLRKYVNDMSISYLSAYYKVDKLNAFAFDLRYFNLGSITFTDNGGSIIRDFTPREFAISVYYSRKLSDNLSVGVGGRFINSNLSADLIVGSSSQVETRPGNTGAADISIYYQSDEMDLMGLPAQLRLGANISNIGAKISYTSSGERDFIPMNLRLGTALTTNIDVYNKFTFALDINKLLVPTPPQINSQGAIVKGRNPRDVSVVQSLFTSFADAPDGFSEEIKEFTLGIGVEYWYDDMVAARLGYFTESADKGGRKYFSIGAGIRYNMFGLDISYLIPQNQNNPLAETLRFSFLFDFNDEAKR
ncbi:MAG: hypothetical protein EAZ55_12955 [Cytophagales bacterium]|nr:MAG: hypothetical protein EAZ55_12955 [Cytophagales bacterium]